MTEVRILPNVLALPRYVAGKAAAYPDAVKLSSNENPYPLPASVLAAITAAAAGVNRYPQMYGEALCEALAAKHALPAEQVVVGNGSVGLLASILQTVAGAGDAVVLPWRSFEAYPIVIGAAGARCENVPLTPEGGHDLPALAARVRETHAKAVLLCSPNNPTGVVLHHDDVRAFAREIPADTLILLDEAYCHFVTDPAGVRGEELVAEFPNLVSLRTFSKAYQLAGLRVGYMLTSDANLAGAIRTVTPPFGVGLVAAAAALAALKEEDYVRETVGKIVAERESVVAKVREMGFTVPETQGNFFWIAQPELVEAITAALTADHITARPFPEGVRVTVGTPEDSERFLAALARVER